MDVPQEIKIIIQIRQENFKHAIWHTQIEGNCTHWVLLLLIFEKIQKNELKLTNKIPISQQFQLYPLDLTQVEDSYELGFLLQYLVFTQSYELSLIIAKYIFGDGRQAQKTIISKAKTFGIDISSETYITNTIQNLYVLARAIFSMPIDLIRQVFIKKLSIGSQKIRPISSLFTCHQLDAVLCITRKYKKYYFTYCNKNQNIGIFQLLDDIHRIDHLVPYYHYFNSGLLPAKKISLKSHCINIIGDTYFGEYYTKRRKAKGIDDALQRYGYQHSFERIKQFFAEDDLNIANFEAVFNLDEYSPLHGKKDFILGADSQQTLTEFKRIHINALCLGNNHLKDYGTESLTHSLAVLDQSEINWIGAGNNQQQAHQYFQIQTQQQNVAIFNGYWHRESAYQDYDFYALGNRAGVACLNAILFEQIIQYRQLHPTHKIIVICHWGQDFQTTEVDQEKLADILTKIGVDLVIGHGAHTIQPIQKINHKPVILGIGNGVFNSNGEFEKYQALAYGLIVKINLIENLIKLYPIYTNNLETFWQPCAVTDIQFKQAKENLTTRLTQKDFFEGKDHLGHYIEMNF
ncbi:CapA family protein [Acinetobacter sp. TR3]|uniref:CapA family protein n=1 Tax=Acinetobacter sp. TR3 TaxID=3003392 RepID=UPI0022AC74DD|nr:CapA family protein [Acinetobacter sp. TR3]WAU75810.1 CapA family protein [Acinetobacter sp. TR3]